MQLKLVKCYRLMLSIFCLIAATCGIAQSSSKHFTPSPITNYTSSMSYIYLQDSIDVELLKLFEFDAKQVLERITENGGTTTPLKYHYLQYVDGIANDQTKSRIEVHYQLTSNTIYITENDLYALGLKFRALRDDFFKSVEVPGLARTYKAISPIGGDKIVVKEDGSVETFENENLTIYEDGNALLNYFTSDWTKVLQEGTYTQLDGGRQKIVGRASDADFTILRNNDGTFSGVTTQMQVPGGWTMKTVCHFDEWTTGSSILVPGKMDWSTSMVTDDLEITLVDSHIRLLNLEDKDFIKPR